MHYPLTKPNFSDCQKQYIYFVRHGIAQHNVRDPKTGQLRDVMDPNLEDPPLTDLGKEQARHAGCRLQRINFDLILTSPLIRCLETAELITQEWKKERIRTNDNIEKTLPVPETVCIENVREAFGIHYPDKRSKKSKLQSLWPTITFDSDMPEEDIFWKKDKRETFDDVKIRVEFFFRWLSMMRPNNNHILVVSHGVWIECLLLHYFPSVLEMGKKRVYNCDIYRVEMRKNQLVDGSTSMPKIHTVSQIE